MERERLSIAALADSLDVSPYTVEAWLLGRHIPRDLVRLSLESMTGGEVPRTGWTRKPRALPAGHKRPYRATTGGEA
jgi:hypothetical protein